MRTWTRKKKKQKDRRTSCECTLSFPRAYTHLLSCIREPEALGPIEDMVLDFLKQLNDAAYGELSRSDSEVSDKEESQTTRLRKRSKVRPKIEIKLADRKKPLDEEG